MKLRNRQNERSAAKTGEIQSDKERKDRRIKIKNMNEGTRFSGTAGNAYSFLNMTVRRIWGPVQRCLGYAVALSLVFGWPCIIV